MRFFTFTTALAAVVAAAPSKRAGCKSIQYDFPDGSGGNAERADAVKQAYVRLWDQYEKYAFGNDTLLSLSNDSVNDFYGWGLTIVDGIDTAVAMGLTDIVAKQLEWIYGVDFTSTPSQVGGFDAVIRYVGGLLSAYDLLTSDLVPEGTYNQTHVDALVTQCKKLADKLKVMFQTPSGLPATFINFNNDTYSHATYNVNGTNYNSVNTANAGTIILEWHRLSDLTGDDTYRQLADKAESNLINPNPTPKFANLVGAQLDTASGMFLTQDFGWQSGIDSFYEYLIKSHIYDPSVATATPYRDYWVTAVESTIEHLALHPYGFDNLTFIAQADNDGNIMYKMDDYSCFIGGNLLLGGKYLDRSDMIDLGKATADSCHKTYNTTASGLNPLAFRWFNGTNQSTNSSQETDPILRPFFDKNGYYIDGEIWTGFPEPIESMFYAYRITGEQRWADYNWEIFNAIQKDTFRTPEVPYADLTDINKPLGGDLVNYVPSYYFAETLKYLYLTFSSPDVVNVDQYVWNTEGHPLRVQNGC